VPDRNVSFWNSDLRSPSSFSWRYTRLCALLPVSSHIKYRTSFSPTPLGIYASISHVRSDIRRCIPCEVRCFFFPSLSGDRFLSDFREFFSARKLEKIRRIFFAAGICFSLRGRSPFLPGRAEPYFLNSAPEVARFYRVHLSPAPLPADPLTRPCCF